MSTRATLTVRDRQNGNEAYHIYRHSDGYPDTDHGVIHTLRLALSYAWKLPRFEAMDFSAAIIAAWKEPAKSEPYDRQGGNICMTMGRDAHGDTAYHYEIYPDLAGKPRIAVETFKAAYPNGYDGATVWVKHGVVKYLTASMQPVIKESA